MLYDPKWETPDKIFERVSLRALIAWLEVQSPEVEYEFSVPDRCVLAQFLQATTGCLSYESMVRLPMEACEDGGWLLNVARGPKENAFRTRTFGDALVRARAALR